MQTQKKEEFDWGCFSDVYKSDYGIRPSSVMWTEEEAQKYLDTRRAAYEKISVVKQAFPVGMFVRNYGITAEVIGYEADDECQGYPTSTGLKLRSAGGDTWEADPEQCEKVT